MDIRKEGEMASTLHAGPAPTGYRASELQRYLARLPALLGALVALIGFILAGGGTYLAALGGSRYYVLVGAMPLSSGYLMITGRIPGFYLYLSPFPLPSAFSFCQSAL